MVSGVESSWRVGAVWWGRPCEPATIAMGDTYKVDWIGPDGAACYKADAGRWKLPPEVFSNALERSAEKAFAGRAPSEAELNRYFDSLHLADLALAWACAMGRNDAWDDFVANSGPACIVG